MALIGSVSAGNPGTAVWANAIRDQGVQVTTSGARPGSPTEGMVIYETDTDRMLRWDGARWAQYTGEIGSSILTSNSSGVNTKTDVSGWSFSCVVPASGIVKLTVDCLLQVSPANPEHAAIYIQEGATVLAFGNIGLPVVSRNYSAHREVRLTPTAGSHTYKVAIEPTLAAGSIFVAASSTTPALFMAELCGA